jgi:hypothetical protein
MVSNYQWSKINVWELGLAKSFWDYKNRKLFAVISDNSEGQRKDSELICKIEKR